MKKIEFVSYDGKYPNLCSGNLILNIDGTDYRFKYVLSSGGSVYFNDDWSDFTVNHGNWSLNVFEISGKYRLEGIDDDSGKIFFSSEEIKFITDLVNENVEEGVGKKAGKEWRFFG